MHDMDPFLGDRKIRTENSFVWWWCSFVGWFRLNWFCCRWHFGYTNVFECGLALYRKAFEYTTYIVLIDLLKVLDKIREQNMRHLFGFRYPFLAFSLQFQYVLQQRNGSRLSSVFRVFFIFLYNRGQHETFNICKCVRMGKYGIVVNTWLIFAGAQLAMCSQFRDTHGYACSCLFMWIFVHVYLLSWKFLWFLRIFFRNT